MIMSHFKSPTPPTPADWGGGTPRSSMTPWAWWRGGLRGGAWEKYWKRGGLESAFPRRASCDPNSQLSSKRGGAAVLGLASGMLKRESGFRLCLEASERRCGMCGGGRDTHSGMPTDPDSIVLTQLCAGGKQNLRALQVWVVGPGMKDEAPLLGWHRA